MLTIKKSLVFLFVGLLFQSFTSVGQDNPDTVIGVWKSGEGNAMVRIYKNGSKYQGKVVWLKEPNDPETGKPKLDKNNEKPSARTKPVLGLINIWGFLAKGDKVWEDGNIYDPKNGNTYSSTMKLINGNSLEVRGYIGVSLIGRTDTWTRQVAK
jgi:uncharacterized protein (DUF2147 family)